MNRQTIIKTLENALLCGDAEAVYLRWMGDFSIATIPNVGTAVPPTMTLRGGRAGYNKVLAAPYVWLKMLMFNVYDTSVSDGATGALAEIRNSLASRNDAYVQTRFLGAAMFDFQPNYFNPQFKVSGRDILDSDPGEAVGMPIPFQVQPYKPLAQGSQKISGIEVFGRAAQNVNGEFVVYPAYCFAEFIIMNTNPFPNQ